MRREEGMEGVRVIHSLSLPYALLSISKTPRRSKEKRDRKRERGTTGCLFLGTVWWTLRIWDVCVMREAPHGTPRASSVVETQAFCDTVRQPLVFCLLGTWCVSQGDITRDPEHQLDHFAGSKGPAATRSKTQSSR